MAQEATNSNSLAIRFYPWTMEEIVVSLYLRRNSEPDTLYATYKLSEDSSYFNYGANGFVFGKTWDQSFCTTYDDYDFYVVISSLGYQTETFTVSIGDDVSNGITKEIWFEPADGYIKLYAWTNESGNNVYTKTDIITNSSTTMENDGNGTIIYNSSGEPEGTFVISHTSNSITTNGMMSGGSN